MKVEITNFDVTISHSYAITQNFDYFKILKLYNNKFDVLHYRDKLLDIHFYHSVLLILQIEGETDGISS